MKPMASMPATTSMASPWKGCSRSAKQSCKPWGENGGAGCPLPTMGTYSWVPQQPRGDAAHPSTPVGAIHPCTGYLRVAVEPGGVQPGIVGTLDVGGHQCQVPALLTGGTVVAQLHVWALQALQALSMKGGETSPLPASTGLPMAWCLPPTPTRGTPGPRTPFPAPYLGAGGRAEPSRTVTRSSQTATAEQGQPLWHWASALSQLDTGTASDRNPSQGPVMSPTSSAVPARQWGCALCTPHGCPQQQLPVVQGSASWSDAQEDILQLWVILGSTGIF